MKKQKEEIVNERTNDARRSRQCPHQPQKDGKLNQSRKLPDGYKDAVDAFINAVDVELGEDDDVVGVERAVGNPILLSERRGRVDDQLVRLFVIHGRRLHLHRVVTITQLGQAEATDILQRVDAFQEDVVMALSADFENGATEQVKLHRQFRRHSAVDHRCILVGRENL